MKIIMYGNVSINSRNYLEHCLCIFLTERERERAREREREREITMCNNCYCCPFLLENIGKHLRENIEG